MSVPKSVVKIKKSGIEYTSNIEKSEYFIFELTRAALRDVGKFVCKKFKEAYYSHFHRLTGNVGKSTKYKVISSKNTKYPRVEVGIKGEGFYGAFQEFGTSKTPKLGLLSKSAKDNIAEIVSIESQYLSALEDEAKALTLIDEQETEGSADE